MDVQSLLGVNNGAFKTHTITAPMSKRQVRFMVMVCGVLVFGALLTALNVYELHKLTQQHWTKMHDPGEAEAEGRGANHYAKPIAWVKGKKMESGYLKHVVNVFIRLGYEVTYNGDENWDVLWAHNYPFNELKSTMQSLKPYQRVNHFPGSGYISNKVSLAVSGLPYIPRAFRMPGEKDALLKFAKVNPNMMFVQKSNNHRGIKIEKLDNLNLGTEGSFVQEFVHNPLLVDGYKFDIGVYTIITSIQPLRVYIFMGDVLFRFCPEKYHPFDPEVRNKYVVGDDYLPTWKVPSLKPFYTKYGSGMKSSFDAWLKSQGKDASVVWDSVSDAIRTVFYAKESLFIQAGKSYPKTHNFFEMYRFDFVIDDQLQVHLMEANMSPNLSSSHFKENRLLYEQVVFNYLSLVGVGRAIHSGTLEPQSKDEDEMVGSMPDIAVFPNHCLTHCNTTNACEQTQCQLCVPCLSSETITDLKQAYREHLARRACRRVVPQAINPDHAHTPSNMDSITAENTLMTEWFRGKCLTDSSFCN